MHFSSTLRATRQTKLTTLVFTTLTIFDDKYKKLPYHGADSVASCYFAKIRS